MDCFIVENCRDEPVRNLCLKLPNRFKFNWMGQPQNNTLENGKIGNLCEK